MSKILGLSFGHSPAAVLIENGKLVHAIEEEKLTRIKGHVSFPSKSIDYILNKQKISAQEIDFVTIGCENIFEFAYSFYNLQKLFDYNNIFHLIFGKLINFLRRTISSFDDKKLINNYFFYLMKKKGFSKNKIHLINHHLSHAASAYYCSNFNNALIFTQDGKGDFACGGLYRATDGKIELKERIEHTNSIGQFYQTVTKYLGFKHNRHEGKITGLAAYGKYTETLKILKKAFNFEKMFLTNKLLLEVDTNPIKYYKDNIKESKWIDLRYLKGTHKSMRKFNLSYCLFYKFLEEELVNYNKKDIASGIQKLTEDSLVEYLKSRLKKNKQYNICLAGGVFANVKLNQRIKEIKNVKNIFVQPAMDDSGTALGSALVLSNKINKGKFIFDNVYLGPKYNQNSILNSFKKYNLKPVLDNNYHLTIAQALNNGKVVGRFSSNLEWGPRALGNRSILVKPDNPEINDILNNRLSRTEFMPFAPIIIEDDAIKILENFSKDEISSKYMTLTYNVNTDYINQIKAAVHIDGTARPQVLKKTDNPDIYKILMYFKELFGLGVVLNTSFNLHEEPIVNSPEDAIKAFLSGAVDILSIENYLIHSN